MKQNAPKVELLLSGCPHCGTRHGLQYYKESNGAEDLYFCNGCYGLCEWNGEHMLSIDGEAYPNRDKSNDLAVGIK
jgi:hypothetical protein